MQPAAIAPAPTRGMRVLIVDDQPSIRGLVGNLLRTMGGSCEMAGSAEEALNRLARDRFDIGLLDIGLPGMDGLTLARRVEERYPDVALVMLTAIASFDAAIGAMQAGAVDYLVKPFTAEGLSRAFTRAAERRRVRLEAARALGFQEVIADRTLEISVLLSAPTESADALITRFLAGLRLRHPEPAAHAERVSRLSVDMAVTMGVPPADIELISRVGLLHDLGKLTLPDALLFKQGALSAQEVQLVRRHPEFGHDVLRRVEALAECAEPVLAQLEHYDGSGTPVGLRGDTIPLAARIVGVANAFDVMTHPRPHATLQARDEALQELVSCLGTQYDPAVLRALFSLERFEPVPDELNSEDS